MLHAQCHNCDRFARSFTKIQSGTRGAWHAEHSVVLAEHITLILVLEFSTWWMPTVADGLVDALAVQLVPFDLF